MRLARCIGCCVTGWKKHCSYWHHLLMWITICFAAECSDPEIEVVIPQLIWAGEMPLPLQRDESVFSNIRRPRSVTTGVGNHPDNMYIHLPALGQNLHLHLQRDNKFLASGFVVEERTEFGEKVQTEIPVDEFCFYTGEAVNHNGSFASLSTCAGLVCICFCLYVNNNLH